MPLGADRIRVLYTILAKRVGVHRYTVVRWTVGVAGTLGVALLPLTDTLRFDLWRGGHRFLGEPIDTLQAAKAFAFPFLLVNIAIVVVTRRWGRYLCGFVCPVGSLARLAEWARYRDRKGHLRVLAPLLALASCAVLGAVTFSFWVDWTVFVEGAAQARLLAAGFLASITLALFGIVQLLGLRFCREWCPSGVYFAVLGHETSNGIEFDANACTDCGVCDAVCPVDLHPRHMASRDALRVGMGFYPDGMSNVALCLRCGDCVVGCEEVGTRGEPVSALRLGELSRSTSDPGPE